MSSLPRKHAAMTEPGKLSPRQKHIVIHVIGLSTEHVTKHVGVSFFSYLAREVSHSYMLREDEQLYSEKQKRVLTFMKTPRELEKVAGCILITCDNDHVTCWSCDLIQIIT